MLVHILKALPSLSGGIAPLEGKPCRLEQISLNAVEVSTTTITQIWDSRQLETIFTIRANATIQICSPGGEPILTSSDSRKLSVI